MVSCCAGRAWKAWSRPGAWHQRIARGDFATRHHLGIHPHINVAESAPEGSDDIEIACCSGWIDLGCRASGYR